MTILTRKQTIDFIWSICNLLRGPYKRNEYRKVILPLTVLRRFDVILEPTKQKVLNEYNNLKGKSENIIIAKLFEVTGKSFYNLSKLNFEKLLDDPNQLAPNLNSYINSYSQNVRKIFEKFDFGIQINRMNEKNLLFNIIKKFAEVDLSHLDSDDMGYVFEELIRIGAEQSNEEAGEHFTPREVIKLMVNLLLSPEQDLRKSHIVKKIYDPACGTGGMLSVAERYIKELNNEAKPHLYGQDWNDEAYAICRSDMLIKGEEAENIILGDTLENDAYPDETFDYMLANPPFGVEWKQQERTIKLEHHMLGYEGRFGAGLPRIDDGSFLFLQHMLAKMRNPNEGGSRIAIVFNGSPLFKGDANSGESNIRQWIIENDWLEAIVALPDQLFYNTSISTFVWIITNRKEEKRVGKIQLIDARNFYFKMDKNLGKKRNQIGDGEENSQNHISEITQIHGNFRNDETKEFPVEGITKELIVSKIFDNADFGYHKITVERPLRLNFQINEERITKIKDNKYWKKITKTTDGQNEIIKLLYQYSKLNSDNLFLNRIEFLRELMNIEIQLITKITPTERKTIIDALSERDENADICFDSKGNPEADTELRDTERIPLKEDIETYFQKNFLPEFPDEWIDYKKTRKGYDIPLNRIFYVYQTSRSLGIIDKTIKEFEKEFLTLLNDVIDNEK